MISENRAAAGRHAAIGRLRSGALAAIVFLGACGSGGPTQLSEGAADRVDAAGDPGSQGDFGHDVARETPVSVDTTTITDEGSGDAASEGPEASADGSAGTDGGAAGTGAASDGPAGSGADGSLGGDEGGVDTTSVVENEVVVLAIEARALVYDSTRHRLYASVDGDAATYANSIVVIDPAQDAVVSSIPVGSDPRPIALSDDDSTLWVGLREANAIRKITLPTKASPDPVVGPLIHVGIDRQKIYFFWPSSLVVLPGAPDSVVLAMSDGAQGPPNVAVLDSGVARPTAINMTNQGPETLVAGPPGSSSASDSMV